jgi:hypothetical protein
MADTGKTSDYYGWSESDIQKLRENAASILANPEGWEPSHFMIDKCRAEREAILEGMLISTLICRFLR